MPLPTEKYSASGAPSKEEITEKIREWIVTAQFAPGEKIADTDIASYFSVSRTPVREVLKKLEQQKLIVTYPGKATVVAELPTGNIGELYIPMRTLQCLAVRLAVGNVGDGDVDRLIELNEDFYVKLQNRGENPYDTLIADREFHRRIEEMSDNCYVRDFCDALWTHVARLDYLFFRDTEMMDSYNEHLEMINAVRLRDPFGAELAMQKNWTNSMLGIQALTEQKDR
ncbi:MAG: GntR family transcriptional regulator [Oscillospiraceae bacterium]|nr:GntR family transcriptional regulator [Oscillospiraceae bacterium]